MRNMKNFILVALTVTLTLSMATLAYETKKFLTKPKKLNPIVRLVLRGRTFCSGTVVNEHTIVTAGHCTLIETAFGPTVNTSPIEIRAEDNTELFVTAKVVYATPQLDIAVLTGEFPMFDYKDIITEPKKLVDLRKKGDGFLSCGYPMGGALFCTPMKFMGPLGFQFAMEGVLIPGMSGGPTMNRDGEVIGINSAVTESLSLISPPYNVNMAFEN
jgi:hypothetical protein